MVAMLPLIGWTGSVQSSDLNTSYTVGKTLPASLETGLCQTYGLGDGLANGVVFSIIQDRSGYIWFATQGGVSRFDGQSWDTFTTDEGLAHNWV